MNILSPNQDVMASEAPEDQEVHDDLAFVAEIFDNVRQMSVDVEGVSRPAYSEVETQTLAYLADVARREGLSVRYDAACNAVFSLPEDETASEFIIVGSHADSVPQGGNFDGLAGIVTGMLCLVRARRAGHSFPVPVKVLAMRGEESAWFGPCYLGSKALTGTLKPQELAAFHKGDKRTLAEHMASVGVPIDEVKAGKPLMDLAQIKAYVELHIEQGPLLVGKGLPAAVVSGIRGNIRFKGVKCIGEAGHSGAVPKAYRRDPVLAMADLLVRLDESWETILNKGDDLVLTSGMVGTDPAKHALSRIPDEVSFSLDIRSQSSETLDEMRDLLKEETRQIERDRKVTFEFGPEISTAPAMCAPDLVTQLQEAMTHAGQKPFVMPSGAGHDAAVFAASGVPSAMVFVRNRNGSHNPAEAMDLDDFIAASDIVYEFLKRAS